MFIEERHQAILDHLSTNGRISIGDIQNLFEVSLDSARRDLRILEEKGLLQRTHGGAIPLRSVGTMPPRFRDFQSMEIQENYDCIAKKAASYINENDIVYVTGGSFGHILLSHLPRNFPYTLVVNSVTLANDLKYFDNLTVYIAGGKMRMNGSASVVDSLATAFIRNMHFDLALLTAGGISANFGVSNGTDEMAAFQRIVMENSRQRVMLLPSAKIGFNAFIKVCECEQIHTLITDWDASEDELDRLRDKGLGVVVVEQA